MKPREHIEPKKQIAAELVERPTYEIDLVLAEFHQPTSDTWDGHGVTAYILEMPCRCSR